MYIMKNENICNGIEFCGYRLYLKLKQTFLKEKLFVPDWENVWIMLKQCKFALLPLQIMIIPTFQYFVLIFDINESSIKFH